MSSVPLHAGSDCAQNGFNTPEHTAFISTCNRGTGQKPLRWARSWKPRVSSSNGDEPNELPSRPLNTMAKVKVSNARYVRTLEIYRIVRKPSTRLGSLLRGARSAFDLTGGGKIFGTRRES